MPRRAQEIYRRGKYWLDWDRKASGELRSPYLTIFWYDEAARRIKSRSSGSAAEEEGMLALDRLYLADRSEAPAYCPHCGQPMARGNAYLLSDAISDYRLEVGDERASGEAIAYRLIHVVAFLTAEDLLETTCEEAARPAFIDRFRTWLSKQPVLHRNGAGVVTSSQPRKPSTTEASVAQLGAALNHAVKEKRSDSRPQWKPKSARQVNQRRRTRIDVETLARMLTYAAEPLKRRNALHAFLVGSICTLARPGAIVEISTDPKRRQWRPGWSIIDLNQAGRSQNKKVRPTLPVLPLLGEWLQSTLDDTEAEQVGNRTGGWLVNYYGRSVHDVDSSWLAMLTELDLPLDREMRPYVLRHSLATIVRGDGVPAWELQAWMGHNAGGTTETYAVEERFAGVQHALTSLIDQIEKLAPGALHRNRTGPASNVIPIRRPVMPSG